MNLKDADGTPVYQSLQNPQIEDFNKRVQDAIDLATSNGVIEKEMSEILCIKDPKIGNLYFLPKIHKKKTPPLGRPICNIRGTMTENISKWTELELQPLVKKLPSHIKDTTDFVKKLEINKSYRVSQKSF